MANRLFPEYKDFIWKWAYPVLENEPQDSGSHLKEKQNGKKDGISRQKGSILSKGAHASREPNDECNST